MVRGVRGTRHGMSRRGLLTAGAGATVAAVLSAGRVSETQAVDGDPLLVGQVNEGTGTTFLQCTGGTEATALSVSSKSGNGIDVESKAPGRSGISARASRQGGFGVEATGPAGWGYLGGPNAAVAGHVVAFGGIPPEYGRIGVAGVAFSTGVYGAGWGGSGVVGESRTGTPEKPVVVSRGALGTKKAGVEAHGGPDAFALWVDGRAAFSRSGIQSVSRGSRSVTITGVPVSRRTFVLATLQDAVGGLVVAAAVARPGDSSIEITLNAPAPRAARVAWLALERAI